MENHKSFRSVRYWLLAGLVMVFMQVIIGGITRLTESGLSITQWEVVTGTLPPLSEEQWQQEFEEYKQTPQYEEINEGMTMDDFRFIYFWEYIHRLWARLMGFVFLIPCIYFLNKRQLTVQLKKDLSVVIVLAMLAATMGWIMVASGLIERPWVNAYKLSLHLLVALSVFIYLLITYLRYSGFSFREKVPEGISRWTFIFAGVLLVQIFLGGVLSGMRAGVAYPTWPDMYGEYLPAAITDGSQWTWASFNYYDANPLLHALIHFLHRNTAYLCWILGIVVSWKLYRNSSSGVSLGMRRMAIALLGMLHLQVILGIITVIHCVGEIPVLWGVLHQAGAILLSAVVTMIIFGVTAGKTIK